MASMLALVRVKRCGKSAPHGWQQAWQGKPHSEQDQIEIEWCLSARGLGRLLEAFGDKCPR